MTASGPKRTFAHNLRHFGRRLLSGGLIERMPKLTAVAYRIFGGEEQAIELAARGEGHDFGGELVLTFEQGRKCFVSWASEPVQYAIGIKDTSFFVPDSALIEVEATHTSMWAALIGEEVSLGFAGADNQVLKIFASFDHVLVCAFERGFWRADQLTVCKEVPAS